MLQPACQLALQGMKGSTVREPTDTREVRSCTCCCIVSRCPWLQRLGSCVLEIQVRHLDSEIHQELAMQAIRGILRQIGLC